MKRLICWLALICLPGLAIAQHEPSPVRVTVLSTNFSSVDGNLDLELRVFADKDIQMDHDVRLKHTEGLHLSGYDPGLAYASITNQLSAGDSITIPISIAYDDTNLSYYYEEIQFQLVESGTDNTILGPLAFVYFTPFETVEVWNRKDFDDLKRVWDSPQYEFSVARVYIDENEIPVSNLSSEDLADPTVIKSYKSIPGLGYIIPMEYVEEEDGGPDEEDGSNLRLARHNWQGDITGYALFMENGVEIPATGIRVEIWDKDGLWDDFIGAGYTDDIGFFKINVNVTQGSEGSELELYALFSAENSNNTIRVITRLNGTRKVTSRQSNTMGWNYQDWGRCVGNLSPGKSTLKPHLLHWANQAKKFSDNELANSNFNLPSSSNDPLDIMITPLGGDGAFFMPGNYRNQAAIGLMGIGAYVGGVYGLFAGTVAAAGLIAEMSNNDGIYIPDHDDEEDEETAFHEFGHYLMWHMQGNSWGNPLEASFVKHSWLRNGPNSKIAWTEGWAAGFSMIMDAYTFRYDNESGNDGIWNVEWRELIADGRRPERIDDNVLNNGIFTPQRTLTHGFVSEFNVGSVIFDLWDGVTNFNLTPIFLHNTPDPNWNQADCPMRNTAWPDNSNRTNTTNDNRFAGAFTANPNDFTQLSFAEICAPILAHRENNVWGQGAFSDEVIQEITEYHKYLLETQNCERGREITDLFTFNRISNFPEQFSPANLGVRPTQRLSSDMVMRFENITTPIFKRNNNNQLETNGNYTYTYPIDVDLLDGSLNNFNVGTPIQNGNAGISDDLGVINGATLFFNRSGRIGFSNSPNNFTSAGSALNSQLCGGVRITIGNNSKIQLGDNSNGNRAIVTVTNGGLLHIESGSQLIVQDNSELIIGPGATLVVRNGATMQVSGTITVQNGGNICIEDGANFIFTSGSTLFVDPAANLGVPSNLGLPTLSCTNKYAICGTLAGGNTNIINTANQYEALNFDGINDLVTIPNNNNYLHNLGQEFTIEAFVRSNKVTQTATQTIVSNRTGFDINGRPFGLTFLIYPSGHLLLQLNGINYGYNQASTLVPLDGQCHYIAVSRDNTNRIRFYIDGNEASYSPVSSLSPVSSGAYRIGGDFLYNAPGENFDGLIGEVRVWNSLRTTAQIQQATTEKITPAPQYGLVAYYEMRDNNQQLTDLSNAVLNGAPLVHGILGTTTGTDLTDPAWVTNCNLTCTIEGNFRVTNNGDYIPDTLGNHSIRMAGRFANSVSSAQTVYAAPNPFKKITNLHYKVADSSQSNKVKLVITSLLGNEIFVLVDKKDHASGEFMATLNAENLPSGTYIYRLEINGNSESGRLILMK